MPQKGCPFQCIYCDQNKITNVPAVGTHSCCPENDTVSLNIEKIKNFILKHKNKYKEIAFYGGTFTSLDRDEITSYFAQICPFLDDKTFFRVSTRPDALSDEMLRFLSFWRVNTIELGIQSFSDHVLTKSERGYTSLVAEKACKMVLEHGFCLSIQFLIGLPGETIDSIKENIKKLVEIKPDFVRLYPLIVLKDTKLETLYKKGEYKALSLDDAVDICSLYLKECENNDIKVIKIGLHSDISKDSVIAGPYHERFGELVKK